jgi:hypothetical protein
MPATLTRRWATAKKDLRKPDQAYMLSADRLLMQTKKDRAQPDLQYFTQSRK